MQGCARLCGCVCVQHLVSVGCRLWLARGFVVDAVHVHVCARVRGRAWGFTPIDTRTHTRARAASCRNRCTLWEPQQSDFFVCCC